MRRALLAHLLGATALVAAAASLPSCGKDSPPIAATTTTTRSVRTYETRFLAAPLDIEVPTWLKSMPDEDAAHFVTFSSSGPTSRAVRIMLPVQVFPPGSATAQPVPTDYLAFLDGQRANGAQLTDRAQTKVDGHEATVMTARTSKSLDGSIGCQERGMSASSCFGLQDDLVLRLAVVDADDGPLLVWLRLDADPAPDLPTEAARFDDFLAGIHFADRTPQIAGG